METTLACAGAEARYRRSENRRFSIHSAGLGCKCSFLRSHIDYADGSRDLCAG
jgi:hypothetical protein